MRFMMLMYPGPAAETETSPVPEGPEGQELLAAMMAFNTRMVEAGVLLGGDGLKPTRKGARVKFGGRGSATVIDGPFTETKEVLGGYWLIKADTLADAIAWARQAPCPAGEMIEIREIYEPEDFGPDVAQEERALIEKMSNRTP
ncbi:MAG: YciI family protein [Alphaproteobacteria bacterium]|nr:YciI family protein [Alphaproteobacteria bacterium]